MRKSLTIFLLLIGLSANAQVDSLDTSYKEVVFDDYNLYGLTANGRVRIWNINTLERLDIEVDTTQLYSSIAKDRNNVIYLGTDKGALLTLNGPNAKQNFHSRLKKPVSIHNIFFNSQNKMFLAVPYCIYDPVKDKEWHKFKITPLSGMGRVGVIKKFLFYYYIPKIRYSFILPKYAFTDSNDRIWMGRAFGEFGTELNVFDAKKEKEIKPDFFESYGSFYLQSVFEDEKGNVYITSGLQHFMNHGEIYKIVDGKAVTIYKNPKYENEANPNDRLFIGPGAFNISEQKIYFATQKGVYRALVPDEGVIKELELVFNPELLYSHENYAIGYQMAIKKMEFTADNKLIFLTANNGIGIYDGREIFMLD